jgi:hypothetical protein
MKHTNTYTNTKVHRNDDGSIVIWFSPDGNPKLKYFAKGDVPRDSFIDGRVSLHLCKKREDWGDFQNIVASGIASWRFGSFYPHQPLGEVDSVQSGICPSKHEHALLHAIDQIPKLKELLK